MNNPFLLGPISNGSSFIMTSIQGTGNQPYILNAVPFGQGIIYYWESDLNTLTSSTLFPVFTASGTAGAATITDTTNNGGISFRADGITIGNAPTPVPINLTQTEVATWWPPDTFLSGIEYTLLNGTGATGAILSTSSGTGPTIPANNIIIVPVLWYFNCTTSGQYDSITTPVNSLINWYCLVQPSNPGCTGIQLVPGGWTNLQDCTNGNMYTYCRVGQNCGASNCNGPCSAIYYDCDLSSGNYVCEFDATKFFEDTPWYTSPYFIGGAIGLLVLIIIIVIVVIVIFHRARVAREENALE